MKDGQKAAWLVAAGVLGVALGFLWGLEFPVIKRFGLRLMFWWPVVQRDLVGAFYWVVDVKGMASVVPAIRVDWHESHHIVFD